MTLDPVWLFVSLFPSGIGFVMFVYGKKQDRWPYLVAGLVLMLYPFFTASTTALIGVGAAVLIILWLGIRSGW